MKKVILFAFALFTTLSLQAELVYNNYGTDGWRIGVDENIVVDIDFDGQNDFYVNQYSGELGFTPIFGKGCFSSMSSGSYTMFGARELRIHSPGDILDQSVNTFAFIDDDRGSVYSFNSDEIAAGWENQEDRYVGFFIFSSGRFGWMKISVDIDAQELIIKEMAYETVSAAPIEIGYAGEPTTPENELPNLTSTDKGGDYENIIETSVTELKEVKGLIVAPNPANDIFAITLNNTSNENLSVVIYNNVGKEVYRTNNNILPGEFFVEVSAGDWSSGIYFIQFQGKKGIKTERLFVVK